MDTELPEPPSTQPPPQSSQWMRHPHSSSWTDSRSLIVLLEGTTLFKVDFGRLEKYAIALQEIFHLPVDNADEGTSESNPVIVEGVTVKDFHCFLTWFDDLRWRGSEEDLDAEFVLSVLSVCHRWMINDGKAWAIARINQACTPPNTLTLNKIFNKADDWRPSITAASRLHMAERLHIPEFVLPAIQELMGQQEKGKYIRSIKDEDIDLMGVKAYSIIAKAQEALQRERFLMAMNVPALVKHSSCQSHHTCLVSWKGTWTKVVVEYLIGSSPLRLSEMADAIRSTSFPDLNLDCHLDTVINLKSERFFRAEGVIIDAVAASVLKAYRLDIILDT